MNHTCLTKGETLQQVWAARREARKRVSFTSRAYRGNEVSLVPLSLGFGFLEEKPQPRGANVGGNKPRGSLLSSFCEASPEESPSERWGSSDAQPEACGGNRAAFEEEL